MRHICAVIVTAVFGACAHNVTPARSLASSTLSHARLPTQAPGSLVATATPILTDSLGSTGQAAHKAVLRVLCPSLDSAGSGFVHESGRVITAAHVVKGCPTKDLQLWGAANRAVAVKRVAIDDRLDLALLEPAESFADGLAIHNADFTVGAAVATWGFPGGYPGLNPLLTVGFLAGASPMQQNGPVKLWVNGAFNGGNSGGPVLLAETGKVVGVVSAKLAPVPESIEGALEALKNQHSGFLYTHRLPNGAQESITEGQVIAAVLQYLRNQTQLVIGAATPAADLIKFLQSQGVTP